MMRITMLLAKRSPTRVTAWRRRSAALDRPLGSAAPYQFEYGALGSDPFWSSAGPGRFNRANLIWPSSNFIYKPCIGAGD